MIVVDKNRNFIVILTPLFHSLSRHPATRNCLIVLKLFLSLIRCQNLFLLSINIVRICFVVFAPQQVYILVVAFVICCETTSYHQGPIPNKNQVSGRIVAWRTKGPKKEHAENILGSGKKE